MADGQPKVDLRRIELFLYGLGATAVLLFGLALVVYDLATGWSSSGRIVYALVLIVVAGAGFGIQLAFPRLNALRIASWLVLGALLVEITCYVFLFAYFGASPVPRSMAIYRQHVFHPSLVALSRPNAKGEMLAGSVNYKYVHNDVGARNVKNFDPTKMSILAIGGSTTYDIGVDNADTWVSVLSQAMPSRFNVLNFGVNSHSTAQHIIFTALRASAYNPRCIIFYVGWNDIRNAHLDHLEPDYSDFALLDQYDELGVIDRYQSWTALGSLARILSSALLNIPRPREAGHVEATSDPRLEKIYRRNIRLLAVITKAIGARPIFIPQVLNDRAFDTATAAKPDAWVPFISLHAIPTVMHRFNEILRDEAEKQGALYIAAPTDHPWQPSDFLDEGHFTVAGSRTFAHLIAPDVLNYCN
jgi:lysophospholipase L1-like esterase